MGIICDLKIEKKTIVLRAGCCLLLLYSAPPECDKVGLILAEIRPAANEVFYYFWVVTGYQQRLFAFGRGLCVRGFMQRWRIVLRADVLSGRQQIDLWWQSREDGLISHHSGCV